MTTAAQTLNHKNLLLTELVSCCKSCFLLHLYQLIDLFFQNLLLLKRESSCWYSPLLLSKPSFETQVLLNAASCFQTVIWRSVCAHNLPSSCIHLDWLCACVCVGGGAGELNSARGNEVNFVCTEASRSVPRATGAPPPSPRGTKWLPHLHIYAAWSVPEFEIESIFSCFLIDLWNVLFFKTRRQNIVSKNYSLSVSEMDPLFQQQHNKVGVYSLSFDPLSELLASPAPCKAWRSCFEIKTFKTQMLKIFLLHIKRCLGNTDLTLQPRYSHHRPWLLRSELWMGFNPPSHWRLFDSRRDALTPAQRGKGLNKERLLAVWSVCVYSRNMCLNLFLLFSHRPVPTAGKTSTTT